MVENKKLGIIVPYRNRKEHLKEFTRRMQRYMERFDIPYELIVVNQDNAKLFNRGMLLNIGFKFAKTKKCDYVVFHDVDMIPVNVDYSYSDHPVHLANLFMNADEFSKKETFDTYFGGVTLFPVEDFEKINGYSNKYWGWGYEDTDLLYRCVKKNIKLDILKVKNMGKPKTALKFNGIDAYVQGRNNFDLNKDISFFVSFYPDEIVYDHMKDVDEFNVFTIPGYDFSICFNSFSRYNFCTFDSDENALYVNSNIKSEYKTNITVTISKVSNTISVYQDGYLLDRIYFFKKLHDYSNEKFFYLGIGNPKRDDPAKMEYKKLFKGYITSFAAFNCVLSDDEVFEISDNEQNDLRNNFGKYFSSENLITYYDANHIEGYKLIDLSGNMNHGKIYSCEIVDFEFSDYNQVKIPYRRDCTFALLPHKENGFYKNKWKFKATRWNQLRFWNEVKKNDELLENDGLSDLEYLEYGVDVINDKITQINVGL